jgi:hypothetical protein
MMLDNQLQTEKSQFTMLDVHMNNQKTQEMSLLQFYAENLVLLLQGYNIVMDRNNRDTKDDIQETMMKKHVVNESNVSCLFCVTMYV